MIPYLLFPRYLLAKLYYESGQHDKAIQVAEELLNSPVKVESSAVNEIRTEMESLLLHMHSTTKTGQDSPREGGNERKHVLHTKI